MNLAALNHVHYKSTDFSTLTEVGELKVFKIVVRFPLLLFFFGYLRRENFSVLFYYIEKLLVFNRIEIVAMKTA